MSEEEITPEPSLGEQPTEDEIRAALDEEMRRVHVGDIVLQSVVSLVNVGARRTGTAPETEPEKDLDQVRIAIEAVRALMPSVDAVAPEQTSAVLDALSQLQMAYVKAGGEAPSDSSGGPDGGDNGPGGPGPGERPSRIWTPGS